MALQTLEGAGGWFPWLPTQAMSEGSTTYVIDAAGEIAAAILRCPKGGTLDRFDAYVHTVTNSPDNGLRFSFQGVDTATGLPNATILGATNNAFVTYAHTVTTGWKQTNFGETVTVTRNQLIACVVDIPSFTASDSIAMRNYRVTSAIERFPYGISATSTKSAEHVLLVGLHYTDGYYSWIPYWPAIESVATISYDDADASADEWGLGFQIPFPAKLNQVRIQLAVAAGGDFEVLVYDSDGTTVLSTLAHDGDVTGAAGSGLYTFFTQTELTLAKDTTYRVSVRPTTANNVQLGYVSFNSAAHMNTMGGGDNWYMTSQLNQGGTWTDYNASSPGFRRPFIFLQLSALDDGVSAGGGINRAVLPSGLSALG